VYLPPAPSLNVTLARAPSGRAGVFHTLRLMRALVDQYKKNPDMIACAVSLVFLCPEKDELSEIDCLFQYVRDSIRYTRDVFGVETICNPLLTIQRKVGDCDDKTTLFATLAECVGYPTRFVMAGYWGSKDYEHVYCQVFANGEWLDADTTEKQMLGYSPPNPSILYTEGV